MTWRTVSLSAGVEMFAPAFPGVHANYKDGTSKPVLGWRTTETGETFGLVACPGSLYLVPADKVGDFAGYSSDRSLGASLDELAQFASDR